MIQFDEHIFQMGWGQPPTSFPSFKGYLLRHRTFFWESATFTPGGFLLQGDFVNSRDDAAKNVEQELGNKTRDGEA